MTIKEYISSGVIELYVLNALPPEEMKAVQAMADSNREVAEEILHVQDSINAYTMAYSREPKPSLRNEILKALANEIPDIQFPPRLTKLSTTEEWITYLSDNSIEKPAHDELIHLRYLPGNQEQATYVAWAKKGAVVEESHCDEDEYLLMLQGYCSVTIDGKLGYYRAGEIAFIPKGAMHRAEVLSYEPMIIIGQRLVA